jgi:hypothetical protein
VAATKLRGIAWASVEEAAQAVRCTDARGTTFGALASVAVRGSHDAAASCTVAVSRAALAATTTVLGVVGGDADFTAIRAEGVAVRVTGAAASDTALTGRTDGDRVCQRTDSATATAMLDSAAGDELFAAVVYSIVAVTIGRLTAGQRAHSCVASSGCMHKAAVCRHGATTRRLTHPGDRA